jgi:ribose 5-phosphate isomerase B
VKKILIVDTGNTCRSPMAEMVLKKRLEENNLTDRLLVVSAGLAIESSRAASRGARFAATSVGMSLENHQARQVLPEQLVEADLVLCMTESHKQLLKNMAQLSAKKVFTLKEYAGESGDVLDPYDKPVEEYVDCLGEISLLIDRSFPKFLELTERLRVAIGSDHGGVNLKAEIKAQLDELNIEYHDFGVQHDEAADYPDIAEIVCKAMLRGEFERGILICGTGIGISISANKIHGIRAALCSDVFSAQATRAHNNTNVLCMGERVIGAGLARMITSTWLGTEFEGGRHERRVDKMMKLEDSE